MKKIFTLAIALLTAFSILGQAPQKMSYQCVVRNAGGALVTNQNVGIKISILQGTPSGTVIYSETYSPNPQTNANGMVSIEIGGGFAITGTFSAINWAAGPYFLKTETDPTGGTSYTITGTSQLLSVPYALYSGLAGNIPDGSVTSAKIADGTIIATDLAANSVDASKIVDLGVSTADLANSSVTSNKIADGTVTAADVQDRLKNIPFTANSLNFDKASTIITQSGNGLKWQSNYSNAAFLVIPKPLDWDEASNVTMTLHFMATTNLSGVVVFFIRPRSFNAGETFTDASALNPVSNISIPSNSIYKVYNQSFTIPASRFGTKDLWVISIQREGTGETYSDDLQLLALELVYTAVQ
jgi:hypothetical protein